MIQKIIVTEGKTDGLLLEKMFSGLNNIKIMAASGYSSALSLASSILSHHKKPVLLLLDADSNDKTDIEKRYQFVENYLNMATPGAIFKVILFEPKMEAVLFEDAKVAEYLKDCPLRKIDFASVRSNPKEWLVLKKTVSDLVLKLNSGDISRLRQLDIFKRIESFIRS